MDELTSRTLFHPFEVGLIEPPGRDQRALLVNAPSGLVPPAGFLGALSLAQDLRPAYRALESAGHVVTPAAEGAEYDLALLCLGRHRGQNELWIADAWPRLREGGLLVVAGGRTDGVASLRRRLAELAAVEGNAAKHHGQVFWMRRPADGGRLATLLTSANPTGLVDGRFKTAPGMFSHDRVDPGSRLLAENLPRGLSGAVADFGAGWGYLSVAVAEHCPGVGAIDLYEASFQACEAARANMAALAPRVEARVLWRDLIAERPDRRYDAVIMNPPFHQGRAAEPALGEAMIAAAHAALRPGGRLALVANRGLAYEKTLARLFGQAGEVARDPGFKVLSARR